VRVSVAFLRFAVSGPAGVADAALAGCANKFKALDEVHQLLFCLQSAQLLLGGHRGDACKVVVAVLQLAQTLS